MRPDIQLWIHDMLSRLALMYGSGAWELGVALRDKMKSEGMGRKSEKESPLLETATKQ
jgi:hypothetical protein